MIGSRVRWVDPDQFGSTQKNLMQVAAAATTSNPIFNTCKLSLPFFKMPTTIFCPSRHHWIETFQYFEHLQITKTQTLEKLTNNK
jgi:hypothetical protein